MKTFIKSLFYAVLVSSFIALMFVIYFLVRTGQVNLGFFESRELITGLAYGIILYLTGAGTGFLLNKWIPNESDGLKRFLFYIPITLILTPVIIFTINFIYSCYIEGHNWNYFVSHENWFAYIPLTIISLLIGIAIYGFYFYKQYKNKQISLQKQIAGKATAQFETLKNQIDPHFLFNSLNVLIGLIEEDSKKAIKYTKSLSRIYRYILEYKDKEWALIEDELDFATNYLELLKLRFEDSIIIDINKREIDQEAYILPLALQLLIENCIQHNHCSEEKPLTIKIYQENNFLVIENNLQKKSMPHESTKIGLQNIKERYNLLGIEPIQIITAESFFIVKLPVIQL